VQGGLDGGQLMVRVHPATVVVEWSDAWGSSHPNFRLGRQAIASHVATRTGDPPVAKNDKFSFEIGLPTQPPPS
jgi:hypothetical protein